MFLAIKETKHKENFVYAEMFFLRKKKQNIKKNLAWNNVNLKQLPRFSGIPQIESIFIYI